MKAEDGRDYYAAEAAKLRAQNRELRARLKEALQEVLYGEGDTTEGLERLEVMLDLRRKPLRKGRKP